LRNPSSHDDELRRREEAARCSEGHSADPILAMVVRILESETASGDLIDVGCGRGHLFQRLPPSITSYTGVDLVQYEGFPDSPGAMFRKADLNQSLPVRDGAADVVVSIETIEHLENPRALFRELVRALRPGGLLLVTTPNQLSALSKLCLVLKDSFAAFQSIHYPAHITALLPSDLMTIGAELKLHHPRIIYSDDGRIPGTARHWPKRLKGRAFSDNVAYVARKPA
jgi:2-polyprenyl-3-methyl-5-hydroxy-6-metoxy-1,4-benzoquinol methylase